MRFAQTIFTTVCSLALVGCVSYGTIEQARKGTGPNCCASFREMHYSELPRGQKRQFDLDTSTRSFAFVQGLSRFVAIRFPASMPPTDLWLKTFWIGNLGPESFVFRPTLTILDRDFSVIWTLTPTVTWTPSFMAAQENLGWEGRLPVPGNASYVVVHTIKDQIGSRLYIKEGVTKPGIEVIPSGSGPIVLQAGWWDVFLPTAESGRIALELIPPK
jgi:hypothetical protein